MLDLNKMYPDSNNCPLCASGQTEKFLAGPPRDFWNCQECELIFVPSPFHLDSTGERLRYETHQNSPEDPRYRSFLGRMTKFLVPKIKQGARGLDFGSGPGPTLAVMLREEGFHMEDYDPYFSPQKKLLEGNYDFITCTETAEHFYEPQKEFMLLDRLLEREGWLGIMTGMVPEKEKFSDWYYHRDPTHVSFFNYATMEWIAHWLGWKVEFPEANVVLFQKN